MALNSSLALLHREMPDGEAVLPVAGQALVGGVVLLGELLVGGLLLLSLLDLEPLIIASSASSSTS